MNCLGNKVTLCIGCSEELEPECPRAQFGTERPICGDCLQRHLHLKYKRQINNSFLPSIKENKNDSKEEKTQ